MFASHGYSSVSAIQSSLTRTLRAPNVRAIVAKTFRTAVAANTLLRVRTASTRLTVCLCAAAAAATCQGASRRIIRDTVSVREKILHERRRCRHHRNNTHRHEARGQQPRPRGPHNVFSVRHGTPSTLKWFATQLSIRGAVSRFFVLISLLSSFTS